MPDSKLQSRIVEFVRAHFPWAEGEHPSRPESPAAQLDHVHQWLKNQVEPFRNAADCLNAQLRPILDGLERESRIRDGERLLARIDDSHVVKSPDGILEKMVREWAPPQVPIDFHNFREKMPDLGRFRVVANFLSDAREIRERIEKAFSGLVTDLPPDLAALRQAYTLENHCFTDSFEVPPGKRTKGERCFKGVFCTRKEPGRSVEVQIVTILGEAWDKKDHFLVYEPRRRGEQVGPEQENEMFGMSELLYLADKTFDRLRAAILGARPPLP